MDDPVEQTLIEKQARVMIGFNDPARAAMLDVEPSEATLDDVAVRAAIDELRSLAAPRDASRAGRALSGVAEALERRWFT